MNKLSDIIKGYNIVDVREAFYYLSRYLKMADYEDSYEKDFFEDDFRSIPSIEAQELTINLIKFIEKSTEKKAAEFTDTEYIQWMDEINEIESNLDPDVSIETIKFAELVIKNLDIPE
ncbi:hypothetical protein ACOL3B_03580 [Aliarcobacter butzleri]|uniref:hypothetical protein n=1 Tax=Aliarcobacter butzleri TaxID=28197 RepID=UPI003AF43FED